MLTLVPEFKNLTMDTPQVYVTIESFEYTPNSYQGQFSSVESIVTPESQSSLVHSVEERPTDLAAQVAQIISDNGVRS